MVYVTIYMYRLYRALNASYTGIVRQWYKTEITVHHIYDNCFYKTNTIVFAILLWIDYGTRMGLIRVWLSALSQMSVHGKYQTAVVAAAVQKNHRSCIHKIAVTGRHWASIYPVLCHYWRAIHVALKRGDCPQSRQNKSALTNEELPCLPIGLYSARCNMWCLLCFCIVCIQA